MEHVRLFRIFTGKAHSSTRGLQDQIGDLLWMRDKRQMAGVHLNRRCSHAFGHKALQIGIDRPILRRNRIEARLRTPGGLVGLTSQECLVKRLLHRVEHPRAGLREVAGKIAQERCLGESAFIVIEHDAC